MGTSVSFVKASQCTPKSESIYIDSETQCSLSVDPIRVVQPFPHSQTR